MPEDEHTTPTTNEDTIEMDADDFKDDALEGTSEEIDETTETQNDTTDESSADEDTSNDKDESDQPSDDHDEFNPYNLPEKERNAYFAQRRIAAKQANEAAIQDLRSSVAERIDEKYEEVDYGDISPEAAHQLREGAKANELMRAEMQIERVNVNRESLANGIERAETNIPVFNRGDSEHYNAELHEHALKSYADAYLDTVKGKDGNLMVIGIKDGAPSPEEHMQTIAQLYGNVTQKATAKGQAAARRNMGRAEHSGSNVKVNTSYDNMSLEEKRQHLIDKGHDIK